MPAQIIIAYIYKKNMKATLKITALVSVFAFASCSSHTVSQSNKRSSSAKSVPPGQAKKITGEKSARNHAPGRRK